jgi:pimeloyl-ACP methyl ester carboxylesterase
VRHIERHKVPVDGGYIDLEIARDDSIDTVVLCIHGWTLDQHSFEGQLELVQNGNAVARYDRRGFGESDLLPNTSEELADIAALIDFIARPVILLGVSQGAKLALTAAMENRSGCYGVILVGGLWQELPNREAEEEGIPLADYAALWRSGNADAFCKAWLSHPLMSRGLTEQQKAQLPALISRYRGLDLAPGVERSVPFSRADLPRFDCKLLTLAGVYYTAGRQHQAQLLAQEGGGEFDLVPGGHLCHATHAPEFNARVTRWLSDLAHEPDGVQQVRTAL